MTRKWCVLAILILAGFFPLKTSALTCSWVWKVGTTSAGGGTPSVIEGWVYICQVTDTAPIGEAGGGGLGGGGSGGGGVYQAPNSPYQDAPATCKSDIGARTSHAGRNFAAWKLATRPLQIVGRGETILITYDDGGTELWAWIGSALITDPASYLHPIPQTLRCP